MMNEEKRFTLRMDADLFEVVKKSAAKNRRSVAKEIEYVLFQWAGLDPDTDEKTSDRVPVYESEGK